MNFWLSWNVGNFLTSWRPVSHSGRTLLQGVIINQPCSQQSLAPCLCGYAQFFLSFLVQQPLPTYHCRCKGHSYIWSHTRISHSRLDASGRGIGPSQKPLPDNTILTTDKHPCPRRDYAQLILKNFNSQLWFHEANGYIWSHRKVGLYSY
jgi:hypothetical protein